MSVGMPQTSRQKNASHSSLRLHFSVPSGQVGGGWGLPSKIEKGESAP